MSFSLYPGRAFMKLFGETASFFCSSLLVLSAKGSLKKMLPFLKILHRNCPDQNVPQFLWQIPMIIHLPSDSHWSTMFASQRNMGLGQILKSSHSFVSWQSSYSVSQALFCVLYTLLTHLVINYLIIPITFVELTQSSQNILDPMLVVK